jgi:hypothetical protein
MFFERASLFSSGAAPVSFVAGDHAASVEFTPAAVNACFYTGLTEDEKGTSRGRG